MGESTMRKIPRKITVCKCTASIIKLAPCILHLNAYRMRSALIKAEDALTKYDVEKYGTVTDTTKDLRRLIQRVGAQCL